MKATNEFVSSAVMPELKTKIENLLNVLSGTIITFPAIVTEVVKIIPTESVKYFEAGAIYEVICNTSLEGRSNLHTLAIQTKTDVYHLQKLAAKMDPDYESTCEMLQELIKQYLTIYSVWEYERAIASGESHDGATLQAELIKHESRLFVADSDIEEDFIEYIDKYLKGDSTDKLPAPLELEFCNQYEEGDLVIVAGRPGMGKSMYLLNCVERWEKLGKRGIVFSLEMSTNQLRSRILNMKCGYDIRNQLDRENEIRQTAEVVRNMNVVYSSARSISQIENKAKLENLAQKLDYIVIDYIQLIKGNKNRNGNRDQELGETARILKELAMSLKIPVIALAQLSRAAESSSDKIPQLSHLRESGSLEQEADIVKFLYRAEYYGIDCDSSGASTKGMANIIVAKYRNGKVGTNTTSFSYINGFYKAQNYDHFARMEAPKDFIF